MLVASRSRPDNSADIFVCRQNTAHGIGRCAQIHGHIELAEDRGKPLSQIGRYTIEQKCRRRQQLRARLAHAKQTPVEDIGA